MMENTVTWGQVGAILGAGLVVVIIVSVFVAILSAYANAWKR